MPSTSATIQQDMFYSGIEKSDTEIILEKITQQITLLKHS